MTFPISGTVALNSADRPRTSGSSSRTASTNLSAGTLTSRSVTSKPDASSREMTMFLPMSWRSPSTVPITTLPAASTWSTLKWGLMTSWASFKITPAIISSDRKYSPASNLSPMMVIPLESASTALSGKISAAMASSQAPRVPPRSISTRAVVSLSRILLSSMFLTSISNFI